MKVGICGSGSIAKFRHAPEFAQNPHTEIGGFFDPVTSRAQELANEFGGKVYASAEELCTDPGLEIVSVCSANKFHRNHTVAALQAGKHVLCEKPMATEIAEAEDMLAAAKLAGKKLMVAENFRVAAAHIKAKQIIEAGEIGKVYTFRAAFGHPGPEYWSAEKDATWFFDKKLVFAGCVGDLGIHKIDMLRWMLDDEVKEVASIMATLEKKKADGTPADVDDNAVSILLFESGIFGTLSVSWTYKGEEDHSTVLYGSEGTLKMYDHPSFPIVVTKEGGEKAFYETGKIPTNDAQFKTGIIDAFVDSIVNDTEPLVTGKDGLEDLRIVKTMQAAAESKKWESNAHT